MNVNWKEAILQAQKKIDQVLDIRPEAVEEDEPVEEVIDQNSPSPSQGSEPLGDDIVMLEPVLPPFLNNRYIGDDIQTIISSDIEHLTRASSRSASPERIKIPSDFEKGSPAPSAMLTPVPALEVALPNPEDILNQAISGLRKELTEYKKANQILQNSHATLEREMEESRFSNNEKVVNMLNEEREHHNQEISQLKLAYSQAISEKKELEAKYRRSESTWSHTRESLQNFQKQMAQMKNTLHETGKSFVADFETFGAEVRRELENQKKQRKTQNKVQRLPCDCEKNFEEHKKVVIKHEAVTQTDQDYQESRQNEEERNTAMTPTGKSNVTDLLKIVEQLEAEKRLLMVQRRSDKREIEKLQQQLNETLVMHGEKIEQLDEVLVDNEELKNILKQQALALTSRGIE